METPTITTSAYSSSPMNVQWQGVSLGDKLLDTLTARQLRRHPQDFEETTIETITETSMPNQNQKRVVKVFIADSDPKVPADKSLLYNGTEHVTDLTDQELFFEVDIKPLLEKHNAERVKIVDKEASAKFGKDIFLEPVKIRDLRMTVVNVATF